MENSMGGWGTGYGNIFNVARRPKQLNSHNIYKNAKISVFLYYLVLSRNSVIKCKQSFPPATLGGMDDFFQRIWGLVP